MLRRLCPALVLCLLTVLPAHAATYHVSPQGSDSTPCGQGPRRTINGGLACLSGGDTLLIGGGTYVNDFIEDFGNAPPPSGSSWASPTTIKAAPGATVWLTGTRNSEGGFISLERTHYLVVDGLNLDGIQPGGGGVFTYGIGEARAVAMCATRTWRSSTFGPASRSMGTQTSSSI